MPYKSKEDQKACQARAAKKRCATHRSNILNLLGNKCIKCDFSDIRAIAIDHKFGGGTKHRSSMGHTSYYLNILKQIKVGSNDYQLLCFNCNQIKKVENRE